MATGTTVFSRVTVVAPTTRIDLALPADVAVADLLPMILDMARQVTPDGGSRHGGWCLAKLGDSEPLDPSQSLAEQGVLDGDILQLRRRADNPPPPLYDDVVDALAEAEPGSYRPWTKKTAAKIGHTAGALGMIAAAAAMGLAGPAGILNPALPNTQAIVYQIIAAVTSIVVAIFATGVGSIVTRAYAAPTTGTVIAAAGGLPMAFVSGFNIVPGNALEPRMLLGSALVLIFSAVSLMVIGSGIIVFIAAATASAFATLGFLIATIFPGLISGPGLAAGASALALAGISLLPRITIQLAKLPLPQVPGSAEDLKEDTEFPEFRIIEQQTGLAHQYMTGLIIGCGLLAALGAIYAASGGVWGVVYAVVAAAVLLLRGRNYANGSQALALLLNGLLAAVGITIGLLVQVASWPMAVAWTFPSLLLLGILSVIFGVVFPNRRFSPVQRRMVDVLEAVLIALVLPLALGAMDVYMMVRDLNIDFF